MGTFVRESVAKWHDEVPGARWFRADLHIHTLDDVHGNATWQAPAGIKDAANPSDPDTRRAYVRAFLKAAIAAGVEVLALTPHSAHIPGDATTSVTWEIVTAWQTDVDDDGVPFREKLYAVFPGFEPSVADGGGGIHLIFLFDPEIGKDRYLKAFTVITGGQNVWHNGTHQTSTMDADQAFDALADLKKREGDGWSYLCIAPHAFTDKGLIRSLKGSLGKHFRHDAVAALELADNDLPEDAISKHPDYLAQHVERYGQSFMHNSDAYCLTTGGNGGAVRCVDSPKKRGLGYRFTFIKLASPRVESLRQAFLSRDSRVRIAYVKDGHGALVLNALSPKPFDTSRPWLRAVTVSGGTAFFGGHGREQTLRFSPDLTCVIGGRMTGKSTLLDGLRTHCALPLPTDASLSEDVSARAGLFLSGNPNIDIDICGPVASTLSHCERWPAKFFTQRELQRIAKDRNNVRQILYHLSPEGPKTLLDQSAKLRAYDNQLTALAGKIAEAREAESEKRQAFKTAQDAKTAMEQFRDSGADGLTAAQADQGRHSTFRERLASVLADLSKVRRAAGELRVPQVNCLGPEGTSKVAAVAQELDAFGEALEAASTAGVRLTENSGALASEVDATCTETRKAVQRALVEKGRKAEDLDQFDALAKIAAGYEAARQYFDEARAELEAAEAEFLSVETARDTLLESHRTAMERITEAVNQNIASIRIALSRASDREHLDRWLRGLRETGVTRWWNDNPGICDPNTLYEKLVDDRLSDVGMSSTVASRFKELMTADRRFALRALRSEDECKIEALVSNGTFRPIEKLSGGKQISVVLSLLLESIDTSPLVIDQPEDELDKLFLAETLLPILRRLKGRRQIIFATHDANIVVNGDADQVILLDATSDSAEVKAQGAIDEAVIRDAVLRILDGGQEAFDMRKRKYGF